MSRCFIAMLVTLGLLMLMVFERSGAQSPMFTQAEQRYQELYNQKRYATALLYAELALKLAQNDPTLSDDDHIELLNRACELFYLRGEYPKAEQLARQVLTVRQRSSSAEFDPRAIAVTQEDIAELLDLQGRAQEGAVFHQQANAFLNSQTRGATAASAIGRQDTVVKQSVFDFYDRKDPEDRGYGRYTYVLFPTNAGGTCDRCLQLLTAFVEGTPAGPVSQEIRAQVNVFEIPVTAGHRHDARMAVATSSPTTSDATSNAATFSSSSTAAKVLVHYEYSSANDLVTRACASYRKATGKFCGTLDQGPYLVTYPRPVSADATLPAPYLIVDMSNMNPRAFHFFVERVKQQVGVGDLTDESRINDTFTRTVSLVLDAADVLDPTAKAVTMWVKMVKR
jgi:tetratricopeptide (TPR) repeat protein